MKYLHADDPPPPPPPFALFTSINTSWHSILTLHVCTVPTSTSPRRTRPRTRFYLFFNTACEHREHASATSFGYDRSRAALLEGAPAMTSHSTPMQVVALGIPGIRGDSGTTEMCTCLG